MNGNIASGGVATFLFWRSAYLSTLFSLRNRTLVGTDWLKVKLFGRCVLSLPDGRFTPTHDVPVLQ
jgi:NADH:ubiquinone reductase (non-electrogenic)